MPEQPEKQDSGFGVQGAGPRGDASPPVDDLLIMGEPIDPQQQAMHGLLWAYFEGDRTQSDERVARILERVWAATPRRMRGRAVPAPSSPPLQARMCRHRWLLSGTGIAAAVLLVAYLLTRPQPASTPAGELPATMSASPDFAVMAEAAVVQPLPMNGTIGEPAMLCELDLGLSAVTGDVAAGSLLAEWWKSLDCGVVQARLDAIETARRRRDELMARLEVSGVDPCVGPGHSLMAAWREVARALRGLGRFEDALAEMRVAIQFGRLMRATDGCWDPQVASCLNDLVETLEVTGDYSAARQARLESIQVRYATWGDPTGPDAGVADDSPCFPGSPLVAPYLSMSWLAVLGRGRAGLPEAWYWQSEAEFILRAHLARVCQLNGIPLAPDATLLGVFAAVPEEFRCPEDTPCPTGDDEVPVARYHGAVPQAALVAWLRCVLFNEARLHRVAGEYNAAAATLRKLAEIPAYPRTDEWRLDFYEPLENARVAILRGHHAEALSYLDVAQEHAPALAATEGEDRAQSTRRPVGLLARAEFDLLRGVALTRLDANDAEGRALVVQALKVPQKIAESVADQMKRQ